MSKVIKNIKLSSKGKNRPFIMGAVFIGGAIIILIMLKSLNLMLLIFGVLSLILGFFNQNINIFQFYEKHLVFQPSVIIKKLVLYNDIIDYQIEKRKLIINYNTDGKTKKIVVFKEMLENSDLVVLEDMITSKTK